MTLGGGEALDLALADDGMGLDADALDDIDKDEGVIAESGSGGDLDVEVDVVKQWGTFLLFLPFGGAFPVHGCSIVGGTKGRNTGSWMTIRFAFGILE